MRFNSTDELEPIGVNDLRGQFFYDLAHGTIRGRAPVSEASPPTARNPCRAS